MFLWIVIILIIVAIWLKKDRTGVEIIASLIAILLCIYVSYTTDNIEVITRAVSLLDSGSVIDSVSSINVGEIVRSIDVKEIINGITSYVVDISSIKPNYSIEDSKQNFETIIEDINKRDVHTRSRMPDIPKGADAALLGSLIRSESRADNMAARLNIRLQRRAHENNINAVRRNKGAKDLFNKEFDYNDRREWWAIDSTEHPIKKLM